MVGKAAEELEKIKADPASARKMRLAIEASSPVLELLYAAAFAAGRRARREAAEPMSEENPPAPGAGCFYDRPPGAPVE